jgi:D-galactarolactone isomerase
MSSPHEETVLAPFSAGQGRARVQVPPGACDCHVHVYDARSPAVPGARLTPPDASVADYRRLQQRTGTQRTVFVTPSTYGSDNRPMLGALAAFGADARGVAVVDAQVGDEQLQALHEAGVRGVRLNLSLGVTSTAAELTPLAARIAPLGWHLQLLAPPALLPDLGDRLLRLPVPLVLDHFGRIAPNQAGGPAHALVLRLLDAGRTWLKLSGGYIVSPTGLASDDGVAALARGYLRAAPQRLVWGSDWPHASASAGHQPMPDDAQQIELLAQWADDATALRRVLVDNPAELYGFGPSATEGTP